MTDDHETFYGSWLVLSSASTTTSLCRCECGTQRIVANKSLHRGASKSCGCKKAALYRQTRKPKYLYQEVEWVAWDGMVRRCTNPRHQSWNCYGGRGIAVCDRWLKGDDHQSGYECFLADLGRRPEGKFSLERIDVDGDYSPENCCWLPLSEQMNNTRRNRVVVHEGQQFTAAQFATHLGLSPNSVLYRLDKGWTPQQIAERPANWRPSKYRRRSSA